MPLHQQYWHWVTGLRHARYPQVSISFQSTSHRVVTKYLQTSPEHYVFRIVYRARLLSNASAHLRSSLPTALATLALSSASRGVASPLRLVEDRHPARGRSRDPIRP